MLPNKNDLINATPRYSKFHDNLEANYIFENIVCNPENIIAMHDACFAGLPALTPIVLEIENYFDTLVSPTFDISTDDYAKTYIGRMVSVVLEPFGLKKLNATRLPKSLNSKYFTSASRYTQSEPPRLKVAKHIVSI